MADEKTTTESTETREEEAPAATTEAAIPTAEEIPTDDEGNLIPTPGDVRTEPVSTAEQSHVKGRVGPPTIQQDANAPEHTGEGVEQIKPGQVMPAETAAEGGPVSLGDAPAVVVARAIDSDEGAAATQTSTASGASGSPTSPAGGSASSDQSGTAGTEPADSGASGSTGDPAGSSAPAGSTESSKSSKR